MAALIKTRQLELDALGTHWWIESLDEQAFSSDAVKQISQFINRFECAYSRFDANSLVGQINTSHELVNPPTELLKMLLWARDFHKTTNGAFNISVGGELNRLGYGQFGAGMVSGIFWETATITESIIRIPNNLQIDFGGFGKGWLIDSLGHELTRMGVRHFVINGGGDILVNSREPLELGLEHPQLSDTIIGTTRITQGALAVSSTLKRRWKQHNTTHHHIINPKDAAPHSSSQKDPIPSQVVSSYVRAASALIADACATALLVDYTLEPSLTKQYGLKVILITEDQLKQRS